MKQGIILTLALLLTVVAWGQNRPGPRGPMGPPPVEKLQQVLDLTDEQVTELEALRETLRNDLQALKDQEFATQEERRDAVKNLMEAHKASVEELLTEAQLSKLEELEQNRPEKRPRLNKEDAAALKQELKAYHEANVLPVLREQRLKLETQLSAADKTQLETLRAEMKAQKEAMKEAKENGAFNHEDRKANFEAGKTHREAVKALVEKYDAGITALLEEIKPQAGQWKTDIEAIQKKYASEAAPQGPQGQGQKMQRGPDRQPEGKMAPGKQRQGMQRKPGGPLSKGAFLLMDPNAPQTDGLDEEGLNLEVFPNPAGSFTTISYEVNQAGKVRIELRDKSGNLSSVLFDGYREAGTFKLEVDTGNLDSGVYYYTITDARGKQLTRQLVISK